jgi:BirA family biotin operon repressor/biotin-[acetyl-CoA-carboxylase] ligase
VVLGVGVNLGEPPAAFPDAGAVAADGGELLAAFLTAFVEGYRPGAADFAAVVTSAYRERCATIGTRVRARTTAGDLVEGEAVDVDEEGGLVVRGDGGEAVVRFGEVEHLE